MKALICGVGGQDGGHLAAFLLNQGYEVVGTSRDAMMASFRNLDRLGIRHRVQTCSMAINDFRSVLGVLGKHAPDEIYNLAGQTSVGLSFEQPVETMESIVQGTLNILEAMRFVGRSIRFYNAGSSECFGDTGQTAANEHAPFQPRSPYAVAKASAHWLVSNYRMAYGMPACTGILFNHESPDRPERFVTQKIIRAAARIKRGSGEVLQLGNLDVQRDWGWSADYVVAMWKMLQQSSIEDLVIATGRTESLEYFVARAFSIHGLDWRDHVRTEASLLRPSDILCSRADPSRARAAIGWRASVDIDGVIERMSAAALEQVDSRSLG
jgi:GDPmannose 4,6-dehydratase